MADKKVYVYKGQHYEIDASLTPEQAKAKIQQHLGEAEQPATTPTQPQQPTQAPKAAPAPAQAPQAEEGGLLGNGLFRMFKGAVIDPAMGAGQLLDNTGVHGMLINPINAIGQALQRSGRLGSTVQQNADINSNVRQLEQQVVDARAANGSKGFDWWQLAGSIVSPFNKVTGSAMTSDAGMLAKAGQAAVSGAAMSAAQPVANADYKGEKATQVTIGSILGGGIQLGLSAVGKVGDVLKTLSSSGRRQAMLDYINTLAGDERDKVVKALMDAKELVTGSRPTVAEAIADIPTAAELAVAQKKLAGTAGQVGKFAQRAEQQQAARAAQISNIAGTDAEKTALIAERARVTRPMREDALNQSDEAGKIMPDLESRIKQDFVDLFNAHTVVDTVSNNRLVKGSPQVTQKEVLTGYADKAENVSASLKLKQFQLKSLEENGFFPLKSSDIIDNINSVLKGTLSDESRAVLNGVKNKILSKTDKNGIISSRELYENIRKVSNADMAKFLGRAESDFANGGIPQQAAKAAGNIKSIIDVSLNKSSEGLWSKYLEKYTDYSTKLNRMEIGDYLSAKLNTPLDKERAGVFATAVENAASTIKNATGIPRYDSLDKVLTKGEMASVNSVLADLNRLDKANRLANRGKAAEDPNLSVAKEIPNLLNRTVSLFKSAVEHLQRGNTKDFNEKMADLMLDPAGLAKFMTDTVPKGKLNQFTSTIMNKLDPDMRKAFVQSFTVVPAAKEVGSGQVTPTTKETEGSNE